MTYGFTAGGSSTNFGTLPTHERFDDDLNIHTFVRELDTIDRSDAVASYSLGDYGFVCGGGFGTLVTTASNRRYDSITDSFMYRQQLITPRWGLAAYAMAGYGFTIGGAITTTSFGESAKTERYDDTINTAFSMADLLVPRPRLIGFSLSSTQQYGYSSCGNWSRTTERLDYIINTQTAVSGPSNIRHGPAGYSLHNFGYVCGGGSQLGAPTYAQYFEGIDKYDGTSNVWTKKSSNMSGRYVLCGYSMNGYGYMSGGDNSFSGMNHPIGVTERYDDNANTVTNRAILNIPRNVLGGYSIIDPCIPISVGLTI